MNILTLLRAPVCPCLILLGSLVLQAQEPGTNRTVTLDVCLRRVAERSPELQAGMYKQEAAEKRALQASRPINPRLETEIENVAGSGALQGFDAAETTVALSQEFELGGKRRERKAVAEAETAVTRAEQAARLGALLFETCRAALAVQVAQANLRLAEESLALIRETEGVANARKEAGKATVLETERAHAETATAEIERDLRKAEQRDAVRNLALLWGETEPSFDTVAGSLDAEPRALPPLETLLAQAAANPDLKAAEALARASEAKIGIERAARVPNVELSAGVRHFQEGSDLGFVVGASIELPFYTRNRDGVRAAEADAEAARLEATVARLKHASQIRRLYARLETLATQKSQLNATVIPSAERALNLLMEAHKQGKAGYLDVLEARRALMEARAQILTTATEYQSMRLELGYLTHTLSENT